MGFVTHDLATVKRQTWVGRRDFDSVNMFGAT